jgi:glycosyltransferase involved in cell wall biosynthesis
MSKVSVLMTTYNRADYLPKAVDSVFLQTFKDWELIVVDDFSADNTEEIMARYLQSGLPIKFVKNDHNIGVVKSRNLALSFCSGEYVAVLDSDDEWIDKDKLQKQVNFLDKNLDFVLCGGGAKIVDDTGEKTGEIKYAQTDSEIRKKILLSNQFIHSSVLYRKNVADSVGGYGDYGVGEDYDLFLKMGLRGKFMNNCDIFIKYCRHSFGLTLKNKLYSAKSHLRIIKKYKNKYPNYYLALSKAYLRIVLSVL